MVKATSMVFLAFSLSFFCFSNALQEIDQETIERLKGAGIPIDENTVVSDGFIKIYHDRKVVFGQISTEVYCEDFNVHRILDLNVILNKDGSELNKSKVFYEYRLNNNERSKSDFTKTSSKVLGKGFQNETAFIQGLQGLENILSNQKYVADFKRDTNFNLYRLEDLNQLVTMIQVKESKIIAEIFLKERFVEIMFEMKNGVSVLKKAELLPLEKPITNDENNEIKGSE